MDTRHSSPIFFFFWLPGNEATPRVDLRMCILFYWLYNLGLYRLWKINGALEHFHNCTPHCQTLHSVQLAAFCCSIWFQLLPWLEGLNWRFQSRFKLFTLSQWCDLYWFLCVSIFVCVMFADVHVTSFVCCRRWWWSSEGDHVFEWNSKSESNISTHTVLLNSMCLMKGSVLCTCTW